MGQRSLKLIAAVLIVLFVLTACQQSAPPAAISQPTVQPTKAESTAPPPTEASKIGGQLNYLGWEGYDDQEAFKPFYDKYGVVPNATYIGGNDEEITKSKAGGPGTYDVGDINARYLKMMVDMGIIIPLDEAKLSNLKDLFPAWKDSKFGYVDGKLYAVPAFYSTTGLCYRADKAPKPTWDFYKMPEYKGKYAVNNNPIGMLYIWGMALGLGQDATEWTEDDLAKIKARGMEEFKDAATMTTAGGGEMKDLLVRGDVLLTTDCWEQVALNAQAQGVDVQYVLPEGPIKANVDIYFIFKGAKNLETAYAWLNHAAGAEAQAVMAKNYGAAVTNEKAYGLMTPELKQKLGYDTMNNKVAHTTFTVMPLPDAQPPNVSLDAMVKTFEEIKTSAGK